MNIRGAAKTILLVDDEAHILHVLSVILRQAGYRVLAAENGERAIELLSEHRADLIISDLQMPTMDGRALASHLYGDERTSSVPIIFLTGNSERNLPNFTPNVRSVIAKPFSPRHVVEQIAQILPPTAHEWARAA